MGGADADQDGGDGEQHADSEECESEHVSFSGVKVVPSLYGGDGRFVRILVDGPGGQAKAMSFLRFPKGICWTKPGNLWRWCA